MIGSSTLADQEVRVLDSDGAPLTIAITRAVEDEQATVVLDEIEEPGTLLDYYFGRGERLVAIELRDPRAGQTVEGTLETWWIAGERRWQVYVDRPLVTLGGTESTRPEPVAGRL
jgi:hypothetical protein